MKSKNNVFWCFHWKQFKKAMEMKTLVMWLAALALGVVLLAFLVVKVLPAVKTKIFP